MQCRKSYGAHFGDLRQSRAALAYIERINDELKIINDELKIMESVGDGILATFDGPARGIRCACAIADDLRPIGIDVRAGLHTGECEVIGNDAGGTAVHIGARVAGPAGAGEVLVSSTVKDLVAGLGLRFFSLLKERRI